MSELLSGMYDEISCVSLEGQMEQGFLIATLTRASYAINNKALILVFIDSCFRITRPVPSSSDAVHT